MNLEKKCTRCNIDLTTNNAAKNGIRNGVQRLRRECKSCYSVRVTKYNTGNENRKAYIRGYIRKIGKVKKYPCETCAELCYKKYARAFCTDKCRFLAYVRKENECWLWMGTKRRRGYGSLCFKENKSAVASRVSYELFKGPIEKGKLICHTCDIPSCVNPDHLWVGSSAENIMDMIEKGRQNSKLLIAEVFKIRKLWTQGWKNKDLAQKFKITSGTVSSIVNKRIWKHV